MTVLVYKYRRGYYYGRPPASWPTAIIFYWGMFLSSYFIFSSPNLGGLWADRHQTLPHVRWWKLSQKFGVPSPKFGGPKTSKFRTSWFDREYLRTGTRYRRSENGFGNCNHSPTCLRKWWTLVHKWRKIGLRFRPTQSTFRTLISRLIYQGLRGVALKISQLVEDDKGLLMHPSLGMGLPPPPKK